jgi:hypothetical protein
VLFLVIADIKIIIGFYRGCIVDSPEIFFAYRHYLDVGAVVEKIGVLFGESVAECL